MSATSAEPQSSATFGTLGGAAAIREQPLRARDVEHDLSDRVDDDEKRELSVVLHGAIQR